MLTNSYLSRVLALTACLGSTAALAAQTPGVAHYGGGCAGAGWTIPTIDGLGVPIPNKTMLIALQGFPGPGAHALLLGPSRSSLPLTPFGFPGCNLLVDPSSAAIAALPVGLGGEAFLRASPNATPGSQLYLQTAFLDINSAVSFSDGLELTWQQAPPLNTSLGSLPAEGSEGATVHMVGSFDTSRYRPQDVFLMTQSSRAAFGSPGGLDRLEETVLSDDLEFFAPFAEPAPLVALFGQGSSSVENGWPTYVHVHTPNDPRVVSPTQFKPSVNLDGPCTAGPSMHQDLRFEFDPSTGKLTLHYPLDSTGAPTTVRVGDELEMLLQITLADGTVVTVSLGPALPLAKGTTWNAFGKNVLVPILSKVLMAACPSCNFNVVASATGICITCSPALASVHPSSFLRVNFDPATHSVLGPFCFGVRDNFATPHNPKRSVPYDTWFSQRVATWSAKNNNSGFLVYDDSSSTANRLFGDTLKGWGKGTVRSATIEIHMKGLQAQTKTDSIRLGYTGAAYPAQDPFVWKEQLKQLKALGYSWKPGDDATVCYDLGALPNTTASGTEYVDLLNEMADGELEVFVGDDTVLDYIEIWLVK